MKFCFEWTNRELLRPSGRRDICLSLFLSAFGGHAPSVCCICSCQIGRIRPREWFLDLRHEILHRMLQSRAPEAFETSRYEHFFVCVRLRWSRPQLFVMFPSKSGESGLGSGSETSVMKFCIEWSNREILGPSGRRDMAVSLFRHSALFPPSAIVSAFGADVPVGGSPPGPWLQ